MIYDNDGRPTFYSPYEERRNRGKIKSLGPVLGKKKLNLRSGQ